MSIWGIYGRSGRRAFAKFAKVTLTVLSGSGGTTDPKGSGCIEHDARFVGVFAFAKGCENGLLTEFQ